MTISGTYLTSFFDHSCGCDMFCANIFTSHFMTTLHLKKYQKVYKKVKFFVIEVVLTTIFISLMNNINLSIMLKV